MIIPVGRTVVLKNIHEQWGHMIYFVHHFESGSF